MNIYLTIHHIPKSYVNQETREPWSDVETELAEHCKKLYDVIEYTSMVRVEELDDTQEWLKEVLFTYKSQNPFSEETVN